MDANTAYQIIDFGLRAVEGAWSPISREISRAAETDDELHAAWTKVDEGLGDLNRLVRARLRSLRAKH